MSAEQRTIIGMWYAMSLDIQWRFPEDPADTWYDERQKGPDAQLNFKDRTCFRLRPVPE